MTPATNFGELAAPAASVTACSEAPRTHGDWMKIYIYIFVYVYIYMYLYSGVLCSIEKSLVLYGI